MSDSEADEDDAALSGERTVALGSISSLFQDSLTRVFGSQSNPTVQLRDDAADSVSGPRIDKLRASGNTTERYVVKGEIGRGGMGAVLKIFDSDLRRNLAMKVILGQSGEGQESCTEIAPSQLLRFLEEAQVTGQLDHPGVVPVHELGIDSEGRVYFTMRLVKGQELAKVFSRVHAGDENWTRTRALGLLLKVCEAMSYAHDKGVVHRDLKPANIMVGRHGEVYVMDWGLARVEGRDDAHDLRLREIDVSVSMLQTDRRDASKRELDSPLITMDGSVVGTPFYMPPEQAAGRLDELGPHSDVYALGSMLYHLLTGRMPYHTPGDRTSPHTVLALVLSGPPTPVHDLAPNTPPELEAICEKAMAREPKDRYRDMGELGDDLRAFVENRVVNAYRTGAIVEFKKWVQRNRTLALTAAALVVLTVGGSASAAFVLNTKNQEVSDARDAALLAKAEADNAAMRESELRAEADRALLASEGVADFLVSQFHALAPESNHGEAIEVKELLDRAVASLDEEMESSPHQAARLRAVLADAYWDIGHVSLAGPLMENALQARIELLGEEHRDSLSSMHNFGLFCSEQGDFERAESLLLRCVELSAKTLGALDPTTLTSRNALASVYGEQSRYPEAEALYQDVLEKRREILGEDHHNTLTTLNDLALLYKSEGRYGEAESLYLLVLEKSRELLGDTNPGTLVTQNNLGALYRELEHYEEAEQKYKLVLKNRTELLGASHPDTLSSANNLGSLYIDMERLDEAQNLIETTLATSRSILGENNPATFSLMNNLASLYEEIGRIPDAEEIYKDTLKRRRELLGDSSQETLTSINNLAYFYSNQDRPAEALKYFTALVEQETILFGEKSPQRLGTLNDLALCYQNMGEYRKAERLHLEAYVGLVLAVGPDHEDTGFANDDLERLYDAWLKKLSESRGPGHAETLGVLRNQALFLARQGNLDQAQVQLQECLDKRLDLLGEEHIETLDSFHDLASLHAEQGHDGEAEALFFECLSGRREVLGKEHPETLKTLEAMTRLFASQKRWSDATPLARQLVKLTGEGRRETDGRKRLLSSIEAEQLP